MVSFFDKKETFKASKYRGLSMGLDISVSVTQVMAFLLLQQSTRTGDLPFYLMDLLIVLVAVVVAILSPFVSWLGSVKRRRTKFVWGCVAASTLLLFFFLPVTVIPGSEYCAATGVPANPTSSGALAARLAMLVIGTVAASVSGVALWNHGVAYIYENDPKINMHLGVLVAAKFLALCLAYVLIKDITLGTMLWMQTLIALIGLVVNLPGLLCSADEVLRVSDDQQGFMTSVGRVLSNGLAMSLMVALSLFTAGLWGFSYNNLDMLRAKYLYQEPDHIVHSFCTLLGYYLVIAVIIFYFSSMTKSLPTVFDRVGTLKKTLMCLILIAIIYVPQGLTSCEKGNVAGLQTASFAPPFCSNRCGCNNPTVRLNPVCLVDDMTTYLSPCHAGCTGIEEFSGISVAVNCTCNGTLQRATLGACNSDSCGQMRAVHDALFLAVVLLGVVTSQNLIVMILEAVDARDKSVALGVTTSFLYVCTFVGGQIVYSLIGESTCLWSISGICQLHKDKYPLYVSMTSLGLTLGAAVLIVLTIFVIKRRMTSP